jgi:hypothetical protein
VSGLIVVERGAEADKFQAIHDLKTIIEALVITPEIMVNIL